MNHNTKNSINTQYKDHKTNHRRQYYFLCLLIICLLSFATTPVYAATYYVDIATGDDSNLGTSAEPWQTLNRCYTWHSGAGTKVTEGDTVLFRDGNYGEFLESTDTNPGASYLFYRNNWITYKANTGHSPILTNININNLDKWGGDGNGNSYLIFDGFTISGSEETVGIYNTSYVQILNCDLQTQPEAIVGYYQPYYLPNTAILSSTDSNFITIQGNEAYNSYRGISVSSGTNWTISSNEIHHLSEDGISALVDTLIIEGNHIYDLRKFSTAMNMYGTKSGDFTEGEEITMPGTTAVGIVLDWHISGYLRVYPITEYTFWDGFHEDNSRTLLGSSSGEILTSLVDADPPHCDGFQIHGTADGVIIRNNHIDRRRVDGLGSEDGQGFKLWSNVTNVTIESNLIDASVPALINGTTVLNMNNNTIYGSSGFRVYGSPSNTVITNMHNNLLERLVYIDDIGGTSVNIVNHSNNMFSSEYSPDGQVGDYPFVVSSSESLVSNFDNLFTDAPNNDFTLAAGSVAINFGNADSDPDTDILGVTRDADHHSAGAYEFTGPALASIDDKDVDESVELAFSISAHDINGDPITYSASGTAITAGGVLTGQNFAWTPNSSQSGTYQVTFTATAGGQTDFETITITVNNINVERILTINSTLGGSVTTPGEGALQYDHGNSVAIAATASANYSFVNWTGTAVVAGKVANANAASTTVTADADYTLFANFTIDQRTVTISSSAGGSVSTPGEGAFQYNHGTSVLIQASPQANYEFVNWTGTAVDAGKVANVNAADTTVTADTAYTLVANFSLVQRTLTISSSSYGSVTTPGEGDLPYDHGTVVPIVATPSGNNYFVNWTGTAVDASKVANANAASTTVTADADYTVVANFAEEDLIAPTLTNLSPADADTQVSIDSLIILTIADAGIGVDLDTVTIDVEGDRIYDGGSETSEGVYESTGNVQTVKGICRRTGTSAAYSFFFQADARFDYEKNITVTVNASDLASTSNDMAEQSYSFYTVMREFEGNAKVNSDTGTLVQDRPAVAKDSNGNIWAVWDQTTIAGDTDVYIGKLAVNDSAFGESTQVTSDTNNQRNAVIAIDSNNKIYLAWEDYRQGEWDVYLATSTDGVTFSTETRITDPNSNQTNPDIAIDSSDKVYIIWEDDQNSNNDIYIASSTNSFVSKTTSQITSNASGQGSPAIAIDSAKTVYVVWTDARNASNDIYGATSTSGPWTNTAIVNNANGQTSPVIATETSGTVLHLLWVDDTNGDNDIFYGATTGGLAGLPLTGTDISDDTTSSDQSNPSIFATGTTGSDLRVFACWKDSRDVVNNNADTDIYYGETALDGSTFGTNVLVNDGSGASAESLPVVDVDIDGNPFLAWVDNRGGNKDIYYAGAMLMGSVLVTSPLITVGTGATVEVDDTTSNIDDATDIRVVIPADALPVDTPITISEMINPPSPPSGGFGVNYEFGPSGLVFNSPVTIYLPHAAADCPGHAIYRAYWYNLELSAWYPPGGIEAQHGVDQVSGVHYITFETDHFTGFGVGGGAAGGGGGGGGGCSMSPDGRGTIVEFLLPYIGLAIVMAIMKLKSKRKKNLHRYTDSD